MTDKNKIYELADKWLKGTITEEEKKYFEQWYNQETGEPLEWGHDASEQKLKNRLFKAIREKIHNEAKVNVLKPFSQKQRYKWMAAAAAVLILFALGFLFQQPLSDLMSRESAMLIDVPPGSEVATLTLADGSVIRLDSIPDGKVATQGMALINREGGQLAYIPQSIDEKDPVLYNTMATARGNQFRIVLSDSTVVWLNSASSLRFPAVFSGRQRLVELSGEAYFEVAENKEKPFMVNVSNKAEVRVLGTHFNINAYDDEAIIKTTLLEGRVSISSSLSPFVSSSLSPGQQAFLDENNKLSVQKADIKKEMAWKLGFFE
ncbi:MAG: FecR domain-containing protein, partial [Chlorobiales bacterium]|nr:FecR domain-containing protein [Chlorobiales bacterium]